MTTTQLGNVAEKTQEAPETPSGERIGILLALLSVYFVWGSTFLAMRIGLSGFSPFLLGGIRFVLSGILLYGGLRLAGVPNPTPRQWGGAAIVGTLLLAGGNGGVVFAEQTVASGLAALGVATVPLWAALFAGVWGQWPTKREGFGMLIGFLGIICLNLEGGMRASPIGAIALLIAGASWALGSVWSKRLSLPAGAMASAAQMLCGGAVLFVLGSLHGEHLYHLPASRALWAMVYLIFGAIVGYSAYTYLLRRVRPALATSYAYVNPAVAMLLGVALGGEHVTWLGMTALTLILAGVALMTIARKPKGTEV